MGVTVQIRPEHNLAVVVHVGRVTDEEFRAAYKALDENDTFDPTTMNRLVDLRETDSSPRSVAVIRKRVESVRAALRNATSRPKVAVIAPKDLTFGLARLYEAYAHDVPWDFVVFRAADAALAWLGLPDDLLDRRGPGT